MKHLSISLLLTATAALGGCATEGPATDGASVRALVARQIAHPQPQRSVEAIDGAAAVNMVKTYHASYANPQPQQAGSAFGK